MKTIVIDMTDAQASALSHFWSDNVGYGADMAGYMIADPRVHTKTNADGHFVVAYLPTNESRVIKAELARIKAGRPPCATRPTWCERCMIGVGYGALMLALLIAGIALARWIVDAPWAWAL